MRLQNAGSRDGTDDEIFMNFAPGDQNQNHNDRPADQGTENAYEDPLDDVFGSAPSSPTLPANNASTLELGQDSVRRQVRDPSDIPRLRSVHVTNGYREGLSASKEQHVQAGFDEGYSFGAELGMKVGWILGVLEGVVRALPANAGAADGETNGWGNGGAECSRDNVRAELARAENELRMKNLFGEEFFGGDGVWTYPVPGAENEGEESATFKEIAEAHPLVVMWDQRIRELADGLGMKIG